MYSSACFRSSGVDGPRSAAVEAMGTNSKAQPTRAAEIMRKNMTGILAGKVTASV